VILDLRLSLKGVRARGLEGKERHGEMGMTREERFRLIGLIADPPPGSKLAAAKDYGIDLTLLVESLQLTPTERLCQLAKAQPLMEELRRARRALQRE